MTTIETTKQYLEIAVSITVIIAACWGFILVCKSFAKWFIQNAKNAADIPLLRKDIVEFKEIIVGKLNELEGIIKRTDGSTIADETAKLSHALHIEQKKNESFSSYFPSRSSS